MHRPGFTPLPPVAVEGTIFHVDSRRPVAVLLDEGSDIPRLVTWNGAPLGRVTTSAHLRPTPRGVWICYRDDDARIYNPGERTSLAVHLSAAGDVGHVPLGTEVVRGADSLGIWSSRDQRHRLDDDYRGGPVTPGWREPMTLTRNRLDGTRDRMLIDRYVYDIREANGSLHVLFAPAPAVATRSGSGVSYSYPFARIELDDVARPPASFVTAEHPVVETSYAEYLELVGNSPPGTPAEPPHVNIEGVKDARWPPAPLSSDDVQRTIEAAERAFSDIDHYWLHPEGATPLARGISEGSAHIEGDWPDSLLIVRFRHPYYADGWIERRIRLFDEAGRIAMSEYADIHLMEVVAMRRFPPLSAAVDGVLVM